MMSFTTQIGRVDWRGTPFAAQMSREDIEKCAGPDIQITVNIVRPVDNVPAHFRVTGFLPTLIGYEINLPYKWNGRFYMYGNGAFAGETVELEYLQPRRDRALENGFATAWTDTGHRSANLFDGSFAEDPIALTNHAYLAVHLTVEWAKKIIETVYGRPPLFSYWDGGSTGGRQGVMEAYRFPKDFDGVLVSAPTLDWTSIMVKGLWRHVSTKGSGLTFAKMATVFQAVMRKCDDLDGLRDGLIDDPRRCDFDPKRDVPRCVDGEDGPNCLTELQAEALQRIYDGPPKGPGLPAWVRDYPGLEHESLMNDAGLGIHWVITEDGSPNALAVMAQSWMKYFAFRDPDYDVENFDFEKDPPRARASDEEMNPRPDLRGFKDAGGKMIIWWGWGDMALNAGMGIDFYDRMVADIGSEQTQDFCRLFLIPGVAHCKGGHGPGEIDGMPALIDWVEAGVAPERLSATRTDNGELIYRRAYFPYPLSTRYRSGDPEIPENYYGEPLT